MSDSTPARKGWLRFSLRDIVFLIALCAVCLGWWADSNRRRGDTNSSQAFVDFEIAQLIEQGGFQVQPSSTERTGNTVTGRSQINTAGKIAPPTSGAFTCYEVYQLVNKRLDAAAGRRSHQEGWHPQGPEHPAQPVRITTFYNQGQRHGEMHLWLFPNDDESEVSYSLYLVEEPLR